MDMGGGRLIRVLIVALTLIVIWKIWEFSSIGPAASPPVKGGGEGSGSRKLPQPQPVQQIEDNRLLKDELDIERTNIGIMKKELSDVRTRLLEKSNSVTNLQIRMEACEVEQINIKSELKISQNNNANQLKMIADLREEIRQFDEELVKAREYTRLLEYKVETLTGKYEAIGMDEELEHQEVPVSRPLRVEVYYEALCPDSRSFVMKQLLPAYTILSDIMDVHIVPYGKAKTIKESTGELGFQCQHGPTECEANSVHACVSNTIKDQAKVLNIVSCMIDRNSNPRKIGQFCVEKFGEAWSDVDKCLKSDKASKILQHMGELTHSLKPQVNFIPTITIDGSQDEQRLILRNFQKVLCNRFKGPKPENCP